MGGYFHNDDELNRRTFGIAIKVEALIKNLLNKKKGFAHRPSEAEKIAKNALAKVEALKKSHAEEFVKFASTLAKIENLKKEVHLSQSKIASMMK